MKLKEYIKEKALFDSINTDGIRDNYADIKKSLKKSNVNVDSEVIDNFENSIDDLDNVIKSGYDDLQTRFYKSVQPKNLARSYDHYDTRKFRALKEVSDEEWDEELKEIILSRMKNYLNFQYPGLEITPRSKIWTKNMTAMDPFFIASKDLDVVEDVASQFHPVYKRRVRVYQYEDADFSQLPQNTFSFVFSWNYFEFLPYDMIDKYLASIYNLLLPGGIFFLSYADCLLEKSATKFENSYYCYMTKELLTGLADKNGFDLIKEENYQFRNSWAIIRKPGELPAGIKEVPSLGYVKNFSLDPIP